PAAARSADNVESELSRLPCPDFPSLPSFQPFLGLAPPMKGFMMVRERTLIILAFCSALGKCLASPQELARTCLAALMEVNGDAQVQLDSDHPTRLVHSGTGRGAAGQANPGNVGCRISRRGQDRLLAHDRATHRTRWQKALSY